MPFSRHSKIYSRTFQVQLAVRREMHVTVLTSVELMVCSSRFDYYNYLWRVVIFGCWTQQYFAYVFPNHSMPVSSSCFEISRVSWENKEIDDNTQRVYFSLIVWATCDSFDFFAERRFPDLFQNEISAVHLYNDPQTFRSKLRDVLFCCEPSKQK